MSLSSLHEWKNLANDILREYESLSQKFSTFQNKNQLSCLEGCGRCCFKDDIYCSPIELLPMALYLLESNKVDEYLNRLENPEHPYCTFLEITDKESFKGFCREYQHRAIICRTFGVSARKSKDLKTDYSVCKTIKENKSQAYSQLIQTFNHLEKEIPYISSSKNNLLALSPKFMEQEYPINQSLRIMLDKVLLISSFTIE